MSKIDVLIIVHNEHEGLLSVGNSEHAHYGCARVGYWGTGKSGYLAKRNTRIYSRFINTFNPNFPKKKLYWQATGTIIKAAATLCKCIL